MEVKNTVSTAELLPSISALKVEIQQIQYPAWTDDDDLMSWLNSFGK